MIELTEDDIVELQNVYSAEHVTLSIGDFIAKPDFRNLSANELISKRLADIMGLICPKYYITEVKKQKYLLSEDLNQYGEFTNALIIAEKLKEKKESSYSDIDINKISSNSLYSIWAYFESIYPLETSKELIAEVLRMYIFDVLFLNFDRELKNWGILTTSDNIPHIAILDDEFILHKDDEEKLLGTTALSVSLTTLYPSVYEDFRQLLRESSAVIRNIFAHYFNLITPEFFASIIEQVENWDQVPVPNKDELIKTYKENRTMLRKIYEEELSQANKPTR